MNKLFLSFCLAIIPWFCQFCSFLEGGSFSRIHLHEQGGSLENSATLYGPREVLEALGRQFFQSSSKKGGVLAQTTPHLAEAVETYRSRHLSNSADVHDL